MQFCRCQDLLNRSSILSKCSFRSTPCCWITGISPSFRRMPWLEISASVIWRMSCSSSSRLRRRASLKSQGLYLSLSLFGLFLPLRDTCLRLRIHSSPLSSVWVMRCTGWCTCRRQIVRRVLWRPRRWAVIDADGPDLAWVGAEGFVYVPGLFGEIVQVLDEIWEGFTSGSYAHSLFELIQVGDVGDQACRGVDWNIFFFEEFIEEHGFWFR